MDYMECAHWSMSDGEGRHEMGFCHGKKGSPPPSSPLPTGPPSPFLSDRRHLVRRWRGGGTSVFFFFLAPSLGHALGHLVSCRGPCRIACCTATAALALPAVVALTNVDATRRTGGLVEHLELIHKNKSLPVPRPWAQDWAKFSVVSGSGRAHVDSRGSGDRKPGRDGLAWHKYVDTYLTC